MRNSDLGLFSIFAILVLLSFGVTNGYIRHRAHAIDQAALDIAENAAPSILHLSTAHREIKDLQLSVNHYLEQAERGIFPPTRPLDEASDRILAAKRRHEKYPQFPDEHALSERVHGELAQLDQMIDQFIELFTARRLTEAKRLAQGELQQLCRRTVESLMDIIALNAKYSQASADRIRVVRRDLARSALYGTSLSVLWTLAWVVVLVYGIRRSAIRDAQQRMTNQRAAELELFAGRVAHDILNPVSVLTYLVRSLETMPAPDELAKLRARASANLKRLQELLDGLLKFACAGASPEPGVCVAVQAVLAELEPELRAQAAAAGIELHVEPFSPVAVACSQGILSSLLTNLAGNAIKYMGAATERRIAIRVLDLGICVRLEVEDTGPGLPPELQRAVFDPHVRAPGSAQPGFGLGLATVRKAAEAHGGKVGVRSTMGRWSLFWIELPKC